MRKETSSRPHRRLSVKRDQVNRETRIEIQTWIVLALAMADLGFLILAYDQMRAHPRMDGRYIAAGMVGFVFHAFLLFEGAFLILQLATIAGLFAICWLQRLGVCLARIIRRRDEPMPQDSPKKAIRGIHITRHIPSGC